MNIVAPQRTITISLVDIPGETKPHAFYSYWDPASGQIVVDAPKCDLKITRPTYCLFVLDYLSTLNGWTISEITEKNPKDKVITNFPGALNLSILTFDDGALGTDYRFFIHYANAPAKKTASIDPQEGNIPGGD